MWESCRILYRGGQGELTEKKSRFIANTRPVESEEEAIAFIEEMRKKYWDARHNCSAYVIGTKGQLQRCSDDGEPAQTEKQRYCGKNAGSAYPGGNRL